MGSGEDEPPAPDATMLMGDEVLREEEDTETVGLFA